MIIPPEPLLVTGYLHIGRAVYSKLSNNTHRFMGEVESSEEAARLVQLLTTGLAANKGKPLTPTYRPKREILTTSC